MKRKIKIQSKNLGPSTLPCESHEGYFISVVAKDDKLFVIWENSDCILNYSDLNNWRVTFMWN